MEPSVASPATWGITGSAFLAIYAGSLAALLLIALGARRAIGAPRVQDPGPGPYGLAYLAGRDGAAVAAALAALRVDGAIKVGEGTLRRARDGPARPDPLEEAVRQAIGRESVNAFSIRVDDGVQAALASLRDELVRSGLLLGPSRRRWIRSTAALPAALLVLGIVRVAAGQANHKPTGYLELLLMVTVAVAAWLLASAPQVSVGGRRAVRRARRANGYLQPSQQPAWSSYGSAAAALGVALFGTAALATVDDLFGTIQGIRPAVGSGVGYGGGYPFLGGIGGGGCGGGGGGCGGGGGGCGG